LGKAHILAFVIALLIIIILLVPIIPVESIKIVEVPVETFTEKTITEKVIRTITTTKVERATWDVTWYAITGEGKFGGELGKTKFPAIFTYDWGYGNVWKDYKDFIGFEAYTTIYVPRDGPVNFYIRSDDGCRLYVDGKLVIDLWGRLFYPQEESKTVYLTKGFHRLRLIWYEWRGAAYIRFNVDFDVVEWTTTTSIVTTTYEQKITTVPTIITVTETKTLTEFVNLLQYLTRK